MSNYIVLLKQVPDVKQISDDAFDHETGTLIRSRLSNTTNELDAQALAFAEQMRLMQKSDGKIISLTMGPPMAEEVLKYSLSRCADDNVLLTDNTLAGADTLATANPLAYAIRKVVSEIFGGSNDYFVICGMQSVDGDTAQVPCQIAKELEIPCIAYATDVRLSENNFEFTRIISGGSEVVKPKRVPALVTVAKYEYPLFAKFANARKANEIQPIRWGTKDVGAKHTGLKGSKTRVLQVFPPGKTSRKCQQLNDVAELAGVIEKAFREKPEQQEESKTGHSYILPEERNSPFDRYLEGTEKENEDLPGSGQSAKEIRHREAGRNR